MKKLFSVLTLAFALFAAGSAFAQTANTNADAQKATCPSKSASAKKCDPAACAAKKAGAEANTNTEESSAKMVEAAGVSATDATGSKTSCASKAKKCDPAACTGKKGGTEANTNTEEGSTKMIEGAGVSPAKKAGCCANKAAAGCNKDKKAEK
ncbi:MAG TPA: hypothetical protein PK239_03615 [Chitinophagales bacterium]|nr:hypothetical protein [Chitinophagales bacterium]HRK26358.1 hypothetical protein [Chitinophagales bacterium]